MMRKPALILLATICFCLNVYADQPIHRPLKAIPFTSVQFKEGFWKSRLEINRTQTLSHNIQKCEETCPPENPRRPCHYSTYVNLPHATYCIILAG